MHCMIWGFLSKKSFISKRLAERAPQASLFRAGSFQLSLRRVCISNRVDLWLRLSPLQYCFNNFLIILTIFISGDQIDLRRRRCT